MSEREPVRTPIRVAPDELAPESIPALPQGEIIPIKPRQFDRLNAFRNMLKTVFDAEKEERENGCPSYFGPINKDSGKVKTPYMRMDSSYRATWNEVAANMYATEIMPDPEMKEVADDLVDQLKLEYDGPPAMSVEELTDLFHR